MDLKEKQLLLADLYARLPYGVICKWENDGYSGGGKLIDVCRVKTPEGYIYWDCYFEDEGDDIPIELVKPYLRPMSSMTEEEKKEYAKVIVKSQDCSLENSGESATTMVNDWLLSKGFDVRGLISKGLALVAPKEMYGI